MTRVTAHTQETVLEATAFQAALELPLNVVR